jgi:hypothetical protein
MKYLLLVIVDEKKLEALSGHDARILEDVSIDHSDNLARGGHLIAAHALHSTESATTVRVRAGKALVTDGPFAETNEQVGGFLLVEAKDLNEAIQFASTMPAAPLGGIEIRPVREIVSTADPARRR